MRDFDYSQIKHYKLYSFIKMFFVPIIKIVFKMKFKGTENIPQNGGYIVAINHTSLVDPVFVAMPKSMQQLHFMSKGELFKNPAMAWLITHLYGFPVKRGKGDTSAINYGIKIINEGHVMAICPEGKRIKDKEGVPQKAKAGVAVIAKATGADILPVAIYCKGKIKAFRRVTVTYGEIIKNEDLNITEDAPSEIKNAANFVMGKIINLWEAENCK